MIRGLISFAVVGIAVIVQLTIVNRTPCRAGPAPMWCWSLVAALALAAARW